MTLIDSRQRDLVVEGQAKWIAELIDFVRRFAAEHDRECRCNLCLDLRAWLKANHEAVQAHCRARVSDGR